MKIACVASDGAGHIDFGGLGYVRLAKHMESLGHQVVWRTYGSQVERLRSAGCDVANLPCISGLILRPFFPTAQIDAFEDAHKQRLEKIRQFAAAMQKLKPDLIVFDRLIAYGGLAAKHLNVPYIAVGTPGGYWHFQETTAPKSVNIQPAPEPVLAYGDYGRLLKSELGWTGGDVSSGWLNSPHLNIHFMPRQFYGEADPGRCANINHFTDYSEKAGPPRIGVSFGNQGDRSQLLKILDTVKRRGPVPASIDVFTGRDGPLHRQLTGKFAGDNIAIHEWADFHQYFSKLHCLIFLGGIGTIWHCLNHTVPMIIVPGFVGDQAENANRVRALGIGKILAPGEAAVNNIFDMAAEIISDTRMRERIIELRSPANFSHSMETVGEKIEQLA